MSYLTNLGQDAKCQTLYASSSVVSPSFSQPYQVVGSPASPSTTANQPYVAGINKYVFYRPLTTGSAIDVVFSITGIPATFAATTSAIATTLAVPSGAFTQIPVISVAHQYTDTVAATYNCRPISSVSPTFTGTAYLKVVIQFTTD